MRKSAEDGRPVCSKGLQCKEHGVEHFASFRHFQAPVDDTAGSTSRKPRDEKRLDGYRSVQLTPSAKKAAPDRSAIYLTKVRGIPSHFNGQAVAIDIKDILAVHVGTLRASAQFNYLIDVTWLIQQYPVESRDKPLLIVHGSHGNDRSELEKESRALNSIQLVQANLPLPFGKHHSKMMLLLYDEGMRVIIHTANLIPQDWDQKTQGVWMSPMFPKSTKSSQFQVDLLAYLSSYDRSALDVWRRHVSSHDMSEANVHLIASVPGRHLASNINQWGHMKLRRVLRQSIVVPSDWPVVAQFSSIGSLGHHPHQWLTGEFLTSLSSTIAPSSPEPENQLQLIFPSVQNVRHSLEGYMAGGSLPYCSKVADKQVYLKRLLHQWRADRMGRSCASPHIKTYTRLSSNGKEMAWFLLTRSATVMKPITVLSTLATHPSYPFKRSIQQHTIIMGHG
jgi:tyrosyl-DNA phosphodiesterase-1